MANIAATQGEAPQQDDRENRVFPKRPYSELARRKYLADVGRNELELSQLGIGSGRNELGQLNIRSVDPSLRKIVRTCCHRPWKTPLRAPFA